MGHADRAKQVFAEELTWIKDPAISQFVLTVFDTFGHDRFWQRPSSLSDKYHPKIAQGNGGLMRHVKYGCFWGRELLRAVSGDGRDGTGQIDLEGRKVEWLDVVTAALILHDLMKDGDPFLDQQRGIVRGAEGEMDKAVKSNGQWLRHIGGSHGVDLAEAIFKRLLKNQASTEQILICYGIAGHMGIWTLPEEWKPANIKNELASKVAHIVHLADYCASRQADKFLLNLMQAVPGTPA